MADRSTGARSGARRATRADRAPRPGEQRPALLVVGTAAAGVAWAVLVVAAIRFGQSARGGEAAAWFFMGLASLGAVACLFLSLVLGWRVSQALRARRAGRAVAGAGDGPAAPTGGKRARR